MKKLGPIAGWLSLITGFIALFFYIALPDLKNIAASLAVIFLLNGIFFIAVQGPIIKQNLSSRSALYGANTLFLTCIFLGILIFANMLAFRHKHRFDFTEGGYFTLAPQTKKFIAELPRDVKLTAFFQTESPEKIAFANLIAGYLEETGNIKLQYVDPDKNPSITKQYGVTTYGTIVLESGDKETKVQNTSEENITNALLKVTRDEQKVIYFLEGHGENNINSTENEGYSSAKQKLEQDGFLVKPLLLLQSGKIPSNASVLVIPGPKKPLQEEEKEAIENYLNSGGSIFMLIDPKSASGMETFLKNWGIELGDDMVIDPMSKLFGGDFAAPVVNQYTAHEITSDFVLATIFPIIRSVREAP
ncbi:MAG: GldG family protein, partial [Nitrospinaceae bacterium]